MKNIVVHLDEDLLGTIFGVPRGGIRSIDRKACSMDFVKICSKLPTTRCAGLFKKLMKSEYRLVFEFVNKILPPRTEKRTSAISAHLFIMESVCKFESLDLLKYSNTLTFRLVLEKLVL